MMEIDITGPDLWYLRDMLKEARDNMNVHNPSYDRQSEISLKVIKKLNRAMTKVYGHDCGGDWYLNKENQNVTE